MRRTAGQPREHDARAATRRRRRAPLPAGEEPQHGRCDRAEVGEGYGSTMIRRFPGAPPSPSHDPLHFDFAGSGATGRESVQTVRRLGAGGHQPRAGRAGPFTPLGAEAPLVSSVRPSFGSCPQQMIGSTSRMQGKEASEQEAKVKSSVGVDVSKDRLDAHVSGLPAIAWRVANTREGIRQSEALAAARSTSTWWSSRRPASGTARCGAALGLGHPGSDDRSLQGAHVRQGAPASSPRPTGSTRPCLLATQRS